MRNTGDHVGRRNGWFAVALLVAEALAWLALPNLIFLTILLLTGLLVILRIFLPVNEIKNLIILFGVAGATVLSFLNFVLFILAYNSPTKSFIVPIDIYGEAEVELVLFSTAVVLIGCSSLWIFKSVCKSGKICGKI